DERAIRHVHDRLPCLGIAVRLLGIRQRAFLVEAVDEGSGRRPRLALVERAAHADVPVREGEQRLAARELVERETAAAERPRLDLPALRTAVVTVAHACSSSSRARSATTISAPASRSRSAWSRRSTPTTYPNPPLRPASTPAIASSN